MHRRCEKLIRRGFLPGLVCALCFTLFDVPMTPILESRPGAVLFGPQPARADIVASQLPTQAGGGAGDTEFLFQGNPVWEISADDFSLTTAATIRHLTWWSFYGLNTDSIAQPPPATQTIRLRVHAPRPGDGMPGDVLFEEFVVDLPRVATGQFIFVGGTPSEYRYDVDLSTPWALDAGQPYWLAIAQMGIPTSTYRWEYAFPNGTPFVFMNPITGDWRQFSGQSNLAFQLSTVPEPAGVLCLTLCAMHLLYSRQTSLFRRASELRKS